MQDHIANNSVGLVCFNLGYLPGGDRHLITQPDTTIAGILAAMHLIRVNMGWLCTSLLPVCCMPAFCLKLISANVAVHTVQHLALSGAVCHVHAERRVLHRQASIGSAFIDG